MTVTYGFYDSSGGDRTYNALQMGSIFDGIISDGIIESIGTGLAITVSTGMHVLVGVGRAWFNRTWTYNDASLQLTFDASDVTLNRIDSVILEVNETNRANYIKVLKGTPASSPVAPTLTNTSTVHQYRMGNISIPAGITTILVGHITSLIGTANCPYSGSIVDTTGNLQAQITALDTDMHAHVTTLQGEIDTDADVFARISEGRLSLVSGNPAQSGSAQSSVVYYTPYIGNKIALYTGTQWKLYSFTELSVSIGGLVANKNYDIFAYYSAGTIYLEAVAWQDNNTRVTSIVFQDGVYVKNGSTTKRYLGTIRTTGTAGQCEDSPSKRFIWNMYNRISRPLYIERISSHTYSSTTKRIWGDDATAILPYVSGLAVNVLFGMKCDLQCGATQVLAIVVGAMNSTSVASNDLGGIATNPVSPNMVVLTSFASKIGNIGYNYMAPLECVSSFAGTGTFANLYLWAVLEI